MLHGDLLGERARLTPSKTALVEVASGRRFTYAELDARAAAAARLLRQDVGLARGDRAGLLAGNSVEFLDIFFGALKAGVVLVPLSTRLTARELVPIVRDSGMRALVYDAATRETVAALEPLAPLERWVTVDERAAPHHHVLADRLAAIADAAWQPVRSGPEDLACLLYTSGTTGRPKGVMIPHRMISWNGYNTVAGWQLREDDVSPIFTPLYHAGALGAFLLPIFTIGGTIVLHRGFDADEVWRTIAEERCTVVLGVPTVWKMLMEAPGFRTTDLGHVRWFISGGAPLPEYLIEAYQRRGVAFKQGYGLTEVGVNCFAMTVEESARKKGSIGKPLMFTETRVVAAGGADAAAGEVGELWLRGPHVCLGYWNDPAATAEALDANGWFHTGDLARRDEEGFHYIAGRRKDMFISGGVNVYPAEVEAELLLHAGVQDAAVVGVPHETWGEMGVAFVVARPGGALTGEALAAHLEGRLARYKIPKAFQFIDALPRTPYGKVVKGELQTRYRQILAHRVSGAGGGVPVLLLNGGMMTFAAWHPVAGGLEPAYGVIAFDFRGQLLSPGEPPASLDGHVADVVALLDHLQVAQVHAVGTSFGAEVGLLLASRRPDRVRSVTAVTATDRLTPEMWAAAQPLRKACRAAAEGGDGGVLFDLMVPGTYSAAYVAAQGETMTARRERFAALPRAWFGAMDALLASLEGLDLTADLRAIRCPALVVGAELDRTFPPAHSAAIAGGIPGAALTIVPGAAHGLVAEAPERVLDALLPFLAKLT